MQQYFILRFHLLRVKWPFLIVSYNEGCEMQCKIAYSPANVHFRMKHMGFKTVLPTALWSNFSNKR